MLAVPLWVLYELGIVVAQLITRNKPAPESDYSPMSETDLDAELDRIEAETRDQK
jgi:sec-independent protein translocase protein TatC